MWNDIKRIDDAEQNVAKFVYTNDTAVAESVLYKYPTYEERTVICCSTQSGCPVGCRFCGAGDNFVRSLTTQEIVDQVDYSIDQTAIDLDSNIDLIMTTEQKAARIKKLQIMFMSMGEPLLNMKNLIPALQILYLKYPHARLLISTSAPDISNDGFSDLLAVSMEIPTIGLQFSLHESTDEARDKLIPFQNKLDLQNIADFGRVWYHVVDDGRKPFFNYCAHDGNSSEEDADRILAKFDPRIFNATVSVICERNEGMPASNEHQRNLAIHFSEKLVERGYDVRVFDPAGQDTIGGGCGQLWFVQDWMRQHPELARESIGHGKEVVHAPAA